MFGLNKIELCLFILALAVIICMPVDAFAAFERLADTGKDIFKGLKKIIYPASAVGIICVCIGGIFGNINWKWLTAVMVGLVVIATCGLFIEMFAGDDGGIDYVDSLNGE